MLRFAILIIGFLSYLSCSAQEYYPGDRNRVIIPTQLYRDLREKFYICDTALAIKDERIRDKDSLISVQTLKIQSLEREITQKDTTISKLSVQFNDLYNSKQKVKPFKHPLTWIGFAVATFFLGITIVK